MQHIKAIIHDDCAYLEIDGRSVGEIFGVGEEANGEELIKQICLCCNSHDGLVEALKEIGKIARTPPQTVADKMIRDITEQVLKAATTPE